MEGAGRNATPSYSYRIRQVEIFALKWLSVQPCCVQQCGVYFSHKISWGLQIWARVHRKSITYKEACLFVIVFRVCAGSSYSARFALGWMGDIVRSKANSVLFQKWLTCWNENLHLSTSPLVFFVFFSKRKFSFKAVAKKDFLLCTNRLFFSALTTVFLLTAAHTVTQELMLCSIFTSQQICEDAAFVWLYPASWI